MSKTKVPTKTSWRDRIAVHPAADLFPLMSPEELKALAKDIKKNGLRESAEVIVRDGKDILIDGRNRLDALELLGRGFEKYIEIAARECFLDEGDPRVSDDWVVPHIISKNLHRRHLTAEQRRELTGKFLKLDPAKSDNALAKITKVSDKTVASVRRELEARSEIPNVDRRTDTRGRKQRAKKAKAASAPMPVAPPIVPEIAAAPVISDELREIAANDAEILQDDDVYDQKLSLEERWNNSIGHFASNAIAMRHLWKKLFGDWQQFKLQPEYLTLIKEAAKEWAELAASLGINALAVADEEREALTAEAEGNRQRADDDLPPIRFPEPEPEDA
jgi:hypothetical protein